MHHKIIYYNPSIPPFDPKVDGELIVLSRKASDQIRDSMITAFTEAYEEARRNMPVNTTNRRITR